MKKIKVKLKDITTYKSSNISESSLKNNHGDFPIYGAGGLIKNITTFQEKTPFIGIVKDGSGVGNIFKCRSNSSVIGTLGKIISNNNIDLDYLYYVFQTINLEKYKVGSSIPHIYYKDFSNVDINIVENIEEQKQISKFLSTIDKTLILLKEEKKQMQIYKKGIMQKIFNQEIRFKDDNGNEFGEWEEKTIGEIFNVTRGNTLTMTKVSDIKTDIMKYPVYSSKTLNNGLAGYYSERLFKDAITWTTDGAYAGTVNYRDGYFYCTNVCGVLLSDEGYANKLIASIIQSVSKHYVSYVGNPKLMNDTMETINIKIPSSIDEQSKISAFMDDIDKQLEMLDKEIEKVENYKKGVMQEIFG